MEEESEPDGALRLAMWTLFMEQPARTKCSERWVRKVNCRSAKTALKPARGFGQVTARIQSTEHRAHMPTGQEFGVSQIVLLLEYHTGFHRL